VAKLAFKATVMPMTIHGLEEISIHYFGATAGAHCASVVLAGMILAINITILVAVIAIVIVVVTTTIIIVIQIVMVMVVVVVIVQRVRSVIMVSEWTGTSSRVRWMLVQVFVMRTHYVSIRWATGWCVAKIRTWYAV